MEEEKPIIDAKYENTSKKLEIPATGSIYKAGRPSIPTPPVRLIDAIKDKKLKDFIENSLQYAVIAFVIGLLLWMLYVGLHTTFNII